jgi:hypothetical protein
VLATTLVMFNEGAIFDAFEIAKSLHEMDFLVNLPAFSVLYLAVFVDCFNYFSLRHILYL